MPAGLEASRAVIASRAARHRRVRWAPGWWRRLTKSETPEPETVPAAEADTVPPPGSEGDPAAAVDAGRNAGGRAFAHCGCWMDPDEAEAVERRRDPRW